LAASRLQKGEGNIKGKGWRDTNSQLSDFMVAYFNLLPIERCQSAPLENSTLRERFSPAFSPHCCVDTDMDVCECVCVGGGGGEKGKARAREGKPE